MWVAWRREYTVNLYMSCYSLDPAQLWVLLEVTFDAVSFKSSMFLRGWTSSSAEIVLTGQCYVTYVRCCHPWCHVLSCTICAFITWRIGLQVDCQPLHGVCFQVEVDISHYYVLWNDQFILVTCQAARCLTECIGNFFHRCARLMMSAHAWHCDLLLVKWWKRGGSWVGVSGVL